MWKVFQLFSWLWKEGFIHLSKNSSIWKDRGRVDGGGGSACGSFVASWSKRPKGVETALKPFPPTHNPFLSLLCSGQTIVKEFLYSKQKVCVLHEDCK